jgi:hypothetical protein
MSFPDFRDAVSLHILRGPLEFKKRLTVDVMVKRFQF